MSSGRSCERRRVLRTSPPPSGTRRRGRGGGLRAGLGLVGGGGRGTSPRGEGGEGGGGEGGARISRSRNHQKKMLTKHNGPRVERGTLPCSRTPSPCRGGTPHPHHATSLQNACLRLQVFSPRQITYTATCSKTKDASPICDLTFLSRLLSLPLLFVFFSFPKPLLLARAYSRAVEVLRESQTSRPSHPLFPPPASSNTNLLEALAASYLLCQMSKKQGKTGFIRHD